MELKQRPMQRSFPELFFILFVCLFFFLLTKLIYVVSVPASSSWLTILSRVFRTSYMVY